MIRKKRDLELTRGPLPESEIVRKYLAGISSEQLGPEHGVSPGTILRLLKRNDVPLRLRRAKVDEAFFDDLAQELPAYWLGFIMADGCVLKSKTRPGRSGTLTISLASKDAQHLNNFKSDIDFTGSLHRYIRHRGHSNLKGCGDHITDQTTIRITSEPLFQRLTSLGVVLRKSLILKFPNCIPDVSMRHFLRGYVDGDGCLYFNPGKPSKRITILVTSGSKDFLAGIQQTICTYLLDIPNGSLLHSHSNTCWSLKWTGLTTCQKIAHYLYDDCTRALERKLLKAQAIMSRIDGRTTRWAHSRAEPAG